MPNSFADVGGLGKLEMSDLLEVVDAYLRRSFALRANGVFAVDTGRWDE